MTPEMYQGQQYQQDLKRSYELAQLDPGAAARAQLGASVGQLGRGFAGALGIEDPQLKRITQRQQLLGMIDPSNPDSYFQAAQMALQGGDAEAAFAFREQGTQARMQAMKNEDYLTQRGAQMQARGLEGMAQNLITQLKNPDGSVNEEVKNRLLSFPQGQAAISQFAKVIPDLRRIGAMGATEDNPFKVFIDDQTIPKTVQTLAKQYSTSLEKGILDPEKVDAKAKELAEMTQRISQFEQNQAQIKNNQDTLASLRSQGLENSRQSLLIQQGNQALQAQNIAFQQDMKKAEADRKAEAARSKPLPSYLAKEEEADYGTATETPEASTGTDDGSVEVDVTDIVDKTEETKTSVEGMSSKMDELLSKLSELENQVSGMDNVINKIDDLEKEIEKRNPTPVERLEMRSMDSFPYSIKLTDFWKDKEGYEATEEEEEEFVLKQSDVDNYNEKDIRKSFT